MKWLGAWVFYWAGDFVSRIDRNLPDWRWTNLYPLYHWLMCRSDDCQGDQFEWGPWQKPTE